MYKNQNWCTRSPWHKYVLRQLSVEKVKGQGRKNLHKLVSSCLLLLLISIFVQSANFSVVTHVRPNSRKDRLLGIIGGKN